jgi:heat shock protein HspQ
LTDEAAALKISQEVKKLIQNYAGVVIISDVDVVWPNYEEDQKDR